MNKELYENEIYEYQKEMFYKVVKLNDSIIKKFKIGDLVYSDDSKKLYELSMIESDYCSKDRKGNINYYFTPDIRIFGTLYRSDRIKSTKKQDFLSIWSLRIATEDDLIKYKKDKREKINTQRKFKYQNDPLFKITQNCRSRVLIAFKANGWKKKSTTEKLLGVPFKIAKAHIERQFVKGMSWRNRSKWHIDHIIPPSSAKTEEDLRKLCHYTNLKPIWAEDNLRKGSKIIESQTTLTI